MTNQATNVDSGFRDHRVEFVREDEPGVTPVDPTWELFSDTLETAVEWDADAQIEGFSGVGDYTVQEHFTGPEDHSLSIEYHLQRFFVDGDGNPNGASGDAIVRTDTGEYYNTHTIVDRAEYEDARTYIVARGCYPNLNDVSGDPGSALPIAISLDYETKKARMFKVEQPSESMLTVRSESAEDTGQTLTLESDGVATSEEVSLDGDTDVTTEETFDSLDAVLLDEPTQGDVVVEDEDGNELVRLRGADTYDGAEGDLGIPALGDGEHADPIGTSYERFIDDEITKGGAQMAAEVRSASFSVDNDISKDPVMGTTEQAIHVGDQTIDFSATVAGNFAHNENLIEHFTAQEFSIAWEFDGGTITFEDCVLTDPGSVGPSAGDVLSTIDNTFEPKGVDVSAD